MPYQDVATVNINLQTTAASQAGFGTQIFISPHAWFRERTRSYGGTTSVDADIPTTAKASKGLYTAFAQPIQPSVVKSGRVAAITTITPDDAVNGKVYTVKVEVNAGASVVATYTATVPTDTQESICTSLQAQIAGDAPVTARVTTTVVGTGAAAVLTIVAKAATDEYAISALAGVTASFVATETASQALTAIEVQDQDFYFVTASDHTETFVLAMAALIETRKKIYFVALKDETSLAVLASPATDTLGKLKDLNYLRTSAMYHQDADTIFPECGFVARWSTADAGTVAWFTKTISGVSSATALNGGTTASPLGLTQKNNLIARNVNFTETSKGVSVLYGGKVVGNEWIDVVRSKDFIEDRTEAAIFNLNLNSGKVPYDADGVASLESVCTTTWNRYISAVGRPNILDAQKPYEANFPLASSVSFNDKAARNYTASAVLYLAGAIRLTTININLTYVQ